MRFILSILFSALLVSCGGGSGGNSNQSGDSVNYTGTWTLSNVKHTIDSDVNSDCTAKDFYVIQDEAKLSISSRQFECNGFTYAQAGMQFTIQNGKLTTGGMDGGEIGPNYIHVKISFTSGGSPSHYTINLDPSADDFAYNENFAYGASSNSTFTATMKRK